MFPKHSSHPKFHLLVPNHSSSPQVCARTSPPSAPRFPASPASRCSPGAAPTSTAPNGKRGALGVYAETHKPPQYTLAGYNLASAHVGSTLCQSQFILYDVFFQFFSSFNLLCSLYTSLTLKGSRRMRLIRPNYCEAQQNSRTYGHWDHLHNRYLYESSLRSHSREQ